MHKITGKTISKMIIQILTGNSYHIAKAYYKYQLHCANKRYKESPLIIYTMGKVGSITVKKSLQALKLDMPIYISHGLTRDYIAPREERSKQYFRYKSPPYSTPWKSQYLRKQIDKRKKDNKWKIITLVREPISVNISNFFHHFRIVEILGSDQCYHVQNLYHNFEANVKLSDIDMLTNFFLERVSHSAPLEFFDRELKSVFNIDVFESEFPRSKGFKIYKGKKADVLVIRLDNLNNCCSDAFKEFLNIDGFTLLNANIGSEKDYASLYQMFKKSVVLPNTYISRMYSSKYMQHFYNDDEVANFKKRWSGYSDTMDLS